MHYICFWIANYLNSKGNGKIIGLIKKSPFIFLFFFYIKCKICIVLRFSLAFNLNILSAIKNKKKNQVFKKNTSKIVTVQVSIGNIMAKEKNKKHLIRNRILICLK